MPSWEHGDLETFKKNAKTNLDKLLPYVEKGAKIIGVNSNLHNDAPVRRQFELVRKRG